MSAERELNDRFAAHVRSASFALTLSHAQIYFLLETQKVNALRAKYDWYSPGQANFGDAESLAVQWSTSTVRSLARRGLVDVEPQEPPCSRYDVIRLTTAGQLVTDLLLEAGFEGDAPPVPRHPDDRARLYFDEHGVCQSVPPPGDRRDPVDVGPWS